jgi:hypothetical protein
MSEWLEQRGFESFWHVERSGQALHVWAGPFGVHVWRRRDHKGRRRPVTFEISF